MAYDFPQCREIRNARTASCWPLEVGRVSSTAEPATSLAQQMDQVEKALIEQALQRCQGRIPAAMELLGTAKKTLYDKLHRHGIDLQRFRC
ncbi:helix-turn-helix domain-containing protein [Roseateles sp. GG27B]